MAFVFALIKAKWLTPLKEPTDSFAGKTIIVTGGNTGLGLESASKFAALGASKVILAVRDMSKGNTAKSTIEDRTGKKNQIEVWELDMGSYESIQAFAERVKQLERLDIALINAGVHRAAFHISKYGWEEDLQVNTLSSVLLALLLLPKLKESKKHSGQIPVLQFTNSGFHQTVRISPERRTSPNLLEAYNHSESFAAIEQYSISKLFLMYATMKLAALTPSEDVIVTSVCPGGVQTGLARDAKGPVINAGLWVFFKLCMRTVDVGARTLVSGPTVGEKAHGRFWRHDTIQPLGPTLVGEENRKIADQVWKEIIQALSKDVPAVIDLVPSTPST